MEVIQLTIKIKKFDEENEMVSLILENLRI